MREDFQAIIQKVIIFVSYRPLDLTSRKKTHDHEWQEKRINEYDSSQNRIRYSIIK